jgi:hypothetical protein
MSATSSIWHILIFSMDRAGVSCTAAANSISETNIDLPFILTSQPAEWPYARSASVSIIVLWNCTKRLDEAREWRQRATTGHRERRNRYNFFTVAGGIPIVVDGLMIGAVGVGGGAGGGDENCAIEGLKTTFGEHVTLPVYPATTSEGRGAR